MEYEYAYPDVRSQGIPKIIGYDETGQPMFSEIYAPGERHPVAHVRKDGKVFPAVSGGAFGGDYVDLLKQPLLADFGAVTPTTTQKAVWPVGASSPTILPANFWYPGRTVRLQANLKLTTGTAGNSTFAMAYGAADAPACVVVTATRAKIASVGPFGVYMVGYATCRTAGTAGTLSMWGMAYPDLGAFLSTALAFVFPSNGTTVVSTIDTTVGTNAPFFEYATSAGTDSIVATNVLLEAMN